MTATTAPARPSLLVPALRLDAVVTGLNGAAYLAAAPLLDDLLGLPGGLLRGAGVVLLAFAAMVWRVAARRPGRTVEFVLAVNVLWALGSVAAVLTDLFPAATAVGTVWLLLQAAVVAALAALQLVGLRRRA